MKHFRYYFLFAVTVLAAMPTAAFSTAAEELAQKRLKNAAEIEILRKTSHGEAMGNGGVFRDKAQKRDAAKVAVADLDAYLEQNGLVHENSFQAELIGISDEIPLNADLIQRTTASCYGSLTFEDPLKRLMSTLHMMAPEKQYLPILLICKAYWTGYADGVGHE